MKKLVSSLFIACAVLVASSCGNGKDKQDIQAPAGMVALDLTKYGKPFAIFVPDTTSAKLQVVEQSWGALEISVGKGFRLSIKEEAGDIELKKSDIKADEVNKFKSFVVEEPTTIFWESEITKPEFHLYSVQKLGNSAYLFEDFSTADSEPLSKDAVQKMLDSAKNLKETKKADA
ncbi:MAG: hypothetical protein JST26_04400 [Bacteroidetes bacterium]|nr:hypothetical protein [Bacteroidota bacterium]